MSKDPEPDGILAHEEVVFDLTTSCTKEQAVMRLLGWGKSDVFRRSIKITEQGIHPDELKSALPTTMTLNERLNEMADYAHKQLIRGAEDDASDEKLDALHDDVEVVRLLASRARTLQLDIEDELAKAKESSLRIDKEATRRTGVTHINIRSLDKWAATLQEEDSTAGQDINHTSKSAAAELNTPKPRQKMRDQENAILRMIQELGHSPKSLSKNDSGKHGVKAEIRNHLASDPLFTAKTSFDKAWDRLRTCGDIADKP